MDEDNKCPMCGRVCKPVNGMSIEEHLSKSLLAVYREIQENNCGNSSLPCPRCGKLTNPDPDENAVSRYSDIYICAKCGTDEADREARNEELPLSQWHLIETVLLCKNQSGR